MEDKINYTLPQIAQIIESTFEAIKDYRGNLKGLAEVEEARISKARNWTERSLQLHAEAHQSGMRKALENYSEAIPANVRENLSRSYQELPVL